MSIKIKLIKNDTTMLHYTGNFTPAVGSGYEIKENEAFEVVDLSKLPSLLRAFLENYTLEIVNDKENTGTQEPANTTNTTAKPKRKNY